MNLLTRFAIDIRRRIDMTIARLRSAFDDPNADGKASMARVCAAAGMYGALWTTKQLVAFAFANKESVGMAGILAGAAATMGATIVLGLLLRKRPDGTSESNDDAPTIKSTVTASTVSSSTTEQS